MPVHVVEKLNRILRSERKLRAERGREPTTEEIARDLDMSIDEVEHIRRSARYRSRSRSRSATTTSPSSGTSSPTRARRYPTSSRRRRCSARRCARSSALSERERACRAPLRARRPAAATLDEVGRAFNVTRERIRQIEHQGRRSCGARRRPACPRRRARRRARAAPAVPDVLLARPADAPDRGLDALTRLAAGRRRPRAPLATRRAHRYTVRERRRGARGRHRRRRRLGRGRIRAAGGEAEAAPWNGGRPLVIGEIRASEGPDLRPRALLRALRRPAARPAGAVGVSAVRADRSRRTPLRAWVADDKGNLFVLVEAARQLAEAGELPSTFASRSTARRRSAATRS